MHHRRVRQRAWRGGGRRVRRAGRDPGRLLSLLRVQGRRHVPDHDRVPHLRAARALRRARVGEGVMRGRGRWLGALLGLAVLAYPWLAPSDYLLRVGNVVLVYAILALALNFTVGWTGQVSP